MEKMIDSTIEIGRPEVALKMEWVVLAYQENQDADTAFEEMLILQKGA